MRRKKKSLVFIILLVFACLGIGYAYLTTTLSINGTTDVDSNSWNVHWDNVEVKTGSVSGSQVTQAPTITNSTNISFHIRLAEPGEYYEFTVDAVNAGTIDAMIENIVKKVNNSTTIPAYLNYTVQYKGSVDIEPNQMLEANSSKKYKVRIEYRTDIDPNQLPSTAQSLDVSFDVSYIQSDSNGQHVPDYLYTTVYRGGAVAGQPLQAGMLAEAYEDYHDIEDPHPFFLRHAMNGNIVEYSEIGIFIYGELYYFRGGISRYDEVRTKMTNLAEEGACSANYSTYTCGYDNEEQILLQSDGSMYAIWGLGISCFIDSTGDMAIFWDD